LGTSGTSGLDGTLFGSSGSSGTSGFGSSGTSGAGTSGTSGFGTSGTSGFLELTGTTDNGVLTYNAGDGKGIVESNLTFNGSVLAITGAMTATTYVAPTTFRETYSNLGTGGSTSIDLATANNFTRTVNTAATFTFTNAPSGKAFGFTLALTNGGAYTITWPGSVRWASGVAPVLTSSGVDILVFYTYDGGTTYYGFLTGRNMQ
jgi:hypothetical protein